MKTSQSAIDRAATPAPDSLRDEVRVYHPANDEDLWRASIANETVTGRTQAQLWLQIRRKLEDGKAQNGTVSHFKSQRDDRYSSGCKLDARLVDEPASPAAIIAQFDVALLHNKPASHGSSRLFRRYYAAKTEANSDPGPTV